MWNHNSISVTSKSLEDFSEASQVEAKPSQTHIIHTDTRQTTKQPNIKVKRSIFRKRYKSMRSVRVPIRPSMCIIWVFVYSICLSPVPLMRERRREREYVHILCYLFRLSAPHKTLKALTYHKKFVVLPAFVATKTHHTHIVCAHRDTVTTTIPLAAKMFLLLLLPRTP